MFSAKAHGAWNFHAVLSWRTISFALLFSSIATFGGLGIAAHAAANTSLDAIACCARESGLQRDALTVPYVLEIGAGAAIAMVGAKGQDPSQLAMSLSIDQLVRSIETLLCSTTAKLSGPLQGELDPLMSAGAPFRMLFKEVVELPTTPLDRNFSLSALTSWGLNQHFALTPENEVDMVLLIVLQVSEAALPLQPFVSSMMWQADLLSHFPLTVMPSS